MKVFHSLGNLKPEDTNQIVVIGNFDGLHKGHQSLISQAKMLAEKENKKVLLLTFEPHPRRLFRPDDPPFRITPYDLKIKKLEEFGVDILVSLKFDWEFASQPAEVFIDEIILNKLQAHTVLVGKDFCFGQLRKGTPEMMKERGVNVVPVAHTLSSDGKKYSSSEVRQLLRTGYIEDANNILGWEWELHGTVVKGDQRGRELGYPTANIPLEETLHPAYGIYACLVQIEDDQKWWPAATNIGIRPMFELQVGQVEAHILKGFDRDIYGRRLRVKPVQRLRGEAKFDSLEALCEQMDKDCQKTLEILQKKAA